MNRPISDHAWRTLVAQLSRGANHIGRRLAVVVYRAQLGPAREAEWRDFNPGR